MSFFKLNFFKINFLNFLIVLIASFFVYLVYFFFKFFFLTNINFYLSFFWKFNISFLSISLLLTGVIVGLFVYWLSDNKIIFNKIFTSLVFILFFILIWFFINEKSYLNLFLIYELFLLPSFFLVYYLSPNRRSIPVAIYFLTWTQFGSLLVLVGIIYIYVNTKSIYLTYSPSLNYNFLFILFFVGFGIKIPLWPFYYWLTKTHVEASSFFSIYLSGFLVKTAIFLFNHFYSYYYNFNYINFLFVIIIIGIIDSSFKMWSQTDLKKLIAYTTVQEMNILCIPLLWNTEFSDFIVGFFIITHCLLSSMLFFIIDIFIKRFNTRVTTKLTGLVHVTPIFSIMIFISLLFFSGLPFTAKFYGEIIIFNMLLNFDFEIFLICFFAANWIGLVGFFKNFYNVLFGSPIISDTIIMDITKREIFIFTFMFVLLFVINFSTLWFL